MQLVINPWSRDCLEKLIVALLQKEFPTFTETQGKYFAVFTGSYNGDAVFISLYFLIFSSHLCLDLSKCSLL
jgi:hypothetical protein